MQLAIAKIKAARAEGEQVTADIYPYVNNGLGVDIREGYDDLLITAKDGTSFSVRLDGAETIQDVLDMINAVTGASVTADLSLTENGIRLTDNTGGAGDFSVARDGLSAAIDGLGLEMRTSGSELVGEDKNGIEPDSIFGALMALHEALLMGGDGQEQSAAIAIAGQRVEAYMGKATRMQGVVGARSKSMAVRLELTESAVISTQMLLSDVKDLDYTEAITRFQQAQTTLQANLMTGSQLLQMSLLDFI